MQRLKFTFNITQTSLIIIPCVPSISLSFSSSSSPLNFSDRTLPDLSLFAELRSGTGNIRRDQKKIRSVVVDSVQSPISSREVPVRWFLLQSVLCTTTTQTARTHTIRIRTSRHADGSQPVSDSKNSNAYQFRSRIGTAQVAAMVHRESTSQPSADPAVRQRTEQSRVQKGSQASGRQQRGVLVQERESCPKTSRNQERHSWIAVSSGGERVQQPQSHQRYWFSHF
jgi:hypothetical protein